MSARKQYTVCTKCKGPTSGTQCWCLPCKNAARRKYAPGQFDALVEARFSARFWQKVERRGPEDCWEWTGARFKSGYGAIGKRCEVLYTHRVSYELHHGPVPPGLYVCHRCDNRPCVNPAHLYAGTAADNSHDAWERGRARTSGKRPIPKDAIRRMREERASGALIRELSERYSLSPSRVSVLCRSSQ